MVDGDHDHYWEWHEHCVCAMQDCILPQNKTDNVNIEGTEKKCVFRTGGEAHVVWQLFGSLELRFSFYPQDSLERCLPAENDTLAGFIYLPTPGVTSTDSEFWQRQVRCHRKAWTQVSFLAGFIPVFLAINCCFTNDIANCGPFPKLHREIFKYNMHIIYYILSHWLCHIFAAANVGYIGSASSKMCCAIHIWAVINSIRISYMLFVFCKNQPFPLARGMVW